MELLTQPQPQSQMHHHNQVVMATRILGLRRGGQSLCVADFIATPITSIKMFYI